MSRLRRSRGIAALGSAAVLLAIAVGEAAAQRAAPAAEPAAAAIGGQVADSVGRPVRYATVWLVPRDTRGLSRGALTDTAGMFAFEALLAGDYYLRVDRIGYEGEWSDRKRVSVGQRMRLAVTSRSAPVRLPPIRQPGACRTGAEIADDTTLATLWGEATKAATARRLFDLSHSYGVKIREELAMGGASYGSLFRGPVHFQTKKLESTPAEARALAEKGSYAGYGVGMDSTRLVAVNEMLELLSAGFASSHCLAVLPDARGRHRIHFQPVRVSPIAADIVGNVLLDEDYRLRRIEFEYIRGRTSFSRGYADFGTAGVHGSAIPFLKHLFVDVYDLPVKGLETLAPDVRLPRAQSYGQRANVYAWYGHVRRDTTAAP